MPISLSEYSERKSFLDDLVEFSIHEPKYGVGTQCVSKTNQLEKLSKLMDMNISPTTIFTKVGATPDAKEIWVGSGEGDEAYLEVKGKVFRILGAASTIKSYFNGYKDTPGISWKADSIETAQCLGLYIDAEGMLEKIGKAGGEPSKSVIDSIKSNITTALGNGQDWDGGGVGKLMEKLPGKDLSLGDITQLLGLAAGMQQFWNSVGKSRIGNANIIHGKINKYYSAEEGNPNVEIQGSKDNTADMIITNTTADELISQMGGGVVEYDKKSTCTIKGTKTKFLQVSLKKARGGAQLGKITGMLQKKYDLPKYEVMLSTLLEQQNLDEIFGIDMSSVKSFFGNIWKQFKKLVGKIKAWGGKLVGSLQKSFNKQVRRDLNDLQKQFDKMPGPKVNLKEAFKFDDHGMICEGLNQELQKLDVPKLNIVRKGIKERLDQFAKVASNPEFTFKKSGDLKGGNLDVGDRYKLFSNYTGAYVFNEVISANKGDMSKLKNEMITMQKEMLFGKTTLPVWKVYGIGGGGNPWEELGGAKEFEEGKKSSFAGLIGAVVGFHASPVKSLYYNLESSFLFGVSEQDGTAIYTLNRMGTNQGGSTFSFVFEGSTTISSDDFLKKYGK